MYISYRILIIKFKIKNNKLTFNEVADLNGGQKNHVLLKTNINFKSSIMLRDN